MITDEILSPIEALPDQAGCPRQRKPAQQYLSADLTNTTFLTTGASIAGVMYVLSKKQWLSEGQWLLEGSRYKAGIYRSRIYSPPSQADWYVRVLFRSHSYDLADIHMASHIPP